MGKVSRKVAASAPPVAPSDQRTLLPHEVLLSANCQSAIGMLSWSNFAGDPNLAELAKGLRERGEKLRTGNMASVEAMLYGQAMTLQTIFTSLARRAAANDGLKQFQVNLSLALKAQSQCRATLEALAEIKNPRQVAFVKQANIAHQQQVNNGSASAMGTVCAGAHAEKTANVQNGLLEAPHGIELDTRAQSTTSGADPHLEAVAAGHRAAHP